METNIGFAGQPYIQHLSITLRDQFYISHKQEEKINYFCKKPPHLSQQLKFLSGINLALLKINTDYVHTIKQLLLFFGPIKNLETSGENPVHFQYKNALKKVYRFYEILNHTKT